MEPEKTEGIMTATARIIDPAAPAPPRRAGPSASRHPPIGGVGRNVIANIEQLRHARGLSFRGLSEHLGAIGRPILPSALHLLSHGKRRVDADDLVALAQVLGVSPADLLAPPSAEGFPAEPHPAQRETGNLADRIGEVLAAPGDPVSAGRLKRALQRVRIEVAELLEDAAARAGKAG
jgi:transcriptional regulator with XRE-family HTH domain